MTPSAPIELTLELPCTPGQAFDAYVDMGSWWDPRYTSDAQTFTGVSLTPGLGGPIVEQHADGSSEQWGTVSLWQPGLLLSYSFVLAHESGVPSQVMVRFAASPSGTTLHFQHGGWNEDNIDDRRRFTDWAPLLAGLLQRVRRSG